MITEFFTRQYTQPDMHDGFSESDGNSSLLLLFDENNVQVPISAVRVGGYTTLYFSTFKGVFIRRMISSTVQLPLKWRPKQTFKFTIEASSIDAAERKILLNMTITNKGYISLGKFISHEIYTVPEFAITYISV